MKERLTSKTLLNGVVTATTGTSVHVGDAEWGTIVFSHTGTSGIVTIQSSVDNTVFYDMTGFKVDLAGTQSFPLHYGPPNMGAMKYIRAVSSSMSSSNITVTLHVKG